MIFLLMLFTSYPGSSFFLDLCKVWLPVHRLTALRRDCSRRLFPANDYYQDDTDVLRSISDPEDLRRHPPGAVAAMKLAIDQMSFSGLGSRAGGAMSDRMSRYKPDWLNSKIEACHEILSSVRL